MDYKYIITIILPSILFGLSLTSFNSCLDLNEDNPLDCYNNNKCQEGTLFKDILLSKFEVRMAIFTFMLGGFISSIFFLLNAFNYYGRKQIIHWNMWIYTVGTILTCIPMKFLLFLGQFTIGFGSGLTRSIVPILLFEIAPKDQKGKFVAIHQIMMNSPFIVLIPFRNIFLHFVPHGWIVIRALAFIPLIVYYFIHKEYLPESPLWLLSQNRQNDALTQLCLIRYGTLNFLESVQLREEINQIKEYEKELSVVEHHDEDLKTIFPSSNSRKTASTRIFHFYKEALVAGVGLMFSQSLTGISTVVYIAKQNSFHLRLVPSILFLSSIFNSFIVDSIGRKILLLRGTNIMTFALLLFSICFITNGENTALLVLESFALCLYGLGFTIGLTTVDDLIICELSNSNLRFTFFSLCTSISWFTNMMSLFINPGVYSYQIKQVDEAEAAIRCNIYAGICFSCTLFMIFFVPETLSS